jgi:hypothetical protein
MQSTGAPLTSLIESRRYKLVKAISIEHCLEHALLVRRKICTSGPTKNMYFWSAEKYALLVRRKICTFGPTKNMHFWSDEKYVLLVLSLKKRRSSSEYTQKSGFSGRGWSGGRGVASFAHAAGPGSRMPLINGAFCAGGGREVAGGGGQGKVAKEQIAKEKREAQGTRCQERRNAAPPSARKESPTCSNP